MLLLVKSVVRGNATPPRMSISEKTLNSNISSSNMSRYLRPDRFDVEPTTTSSYLRWTPWQYSQFFSEKIRKKFTFFNFLTEELPNHVSDTIKFKLLIN